MPNISNILNEQIRRLARREIHASERGTRSANSRARSDIAALKRELAGLSKRLRQLEKTGGRRGSAAGASAVAEETVDRSRFRADGLRSHRARLGISAKDYGTLVGVSGLTVYQWEHGKSKPRKAQFAKLLAVRHLGKREALERLGKGSSQEETTGRGRGRLAGKPRGAGRKRGHFNRTAEQLILDLAQGEGHSTSEINKAWKAEGRAGSADNTLSQMVLAGKIKRQKVEGERGSRYVSAVGAN